MTEKMLNQGRSFGGVYNFRDVGGLPVRPEGRIKPGVLYRSDAFGDATEEDVAYIRDQLAIERILDLRAAREVEGEPQSPFAAVGMTVLHRPIDRGPGNAIEGAPQGERLALRYLEYLQDSAETVVASLRDFVESSAPTIVHCRAGKDRTGVVVAALLSTVGVPHEDVAADYALTAHAMPSIMARLKESATYRSNVGQLPAEMYSAEASTMLKFLELVDQRFGGFAEWFASQGVAADELAQLRNRLTEPSS